MLCHLEIQDFAIVDALTVTFEAGFTTITGETGAGKSIMLDALGLVLGDRAQGRLVREGRRSAQLAAEFSVAAIPKAQAWLDAQSLRDPDAPDRCLLRRTLTEDGRSRAYINGRTVTLGELRALAEQLIDIHAQHAHQSLLRPAIQREQLDSFGQHEALVEAVAEAFEACQDATLELERLRSAQAERRDRQALLRYQLEELDTLNPQAGEGPALEQTQRRLAHAEETLLALRQCRGALLEEDGAVADQLRRLEHQLSQLRDEAPALTSARNLLMEARVNVEEAADALRRYEDNLDPDPEALAEAENRLSALHDAARKHRVELDALAAHHEALAEELASLDADDGALEQLSAAQAALAQALHDAAIRLSKARSTAAKALETAVSGELQRLGMKTARFVVALPALEAPGRHGQEGTEFQIATRKGATPGALGQIASGGELSRISLAILVVTAASAQTPSLVLDEADVGIGGGTAEIVGQLLKTLGAHTQVLAVTHQPQVAAQGSHHLRVRQAGTEAAIEVLSEEERIEELARMLGGLKITAQTRAHAAEMRAQGS